MKNPASLTRPRARTLALAIALAGVLGWPGSAAATTEAPVPEAAEATAAAPGDRWRTPTGDPTVRPDHIPDDETLEANGARFGEIRFHNLNVFDTTREEENNFLFRTANKLHATTREPVIERRVFFETGDLYSVRKIEETERYLRSLGIFYDVWIHPVRYVGNTVDILVTTRDVWTLGVTGSFERAGAENTVAFGLVDSNFLGYAKHLDLRYETNPDRDSFRVRYIDRDFAASENEVHVLLSDNSDGHRRTLDVLRPFRTFDTRWGGGVRLVSDDRAERLWSQGEEVREFQHQREEYTAWGGLSTGFKNGRTHRWTTGFAYVKDDYQHKFDLQAKLPRQNADRVLSFPWVAFERVEDGYVEARDLNLLSRTEDFNLANQFRFQLGASLTSFGASADHLVAIGAYRTGFQPRSGQLIFLGLEGRGLFDDASYEDARLGLDLTFFQRTFGRHQFFASVRADGLWKAQPEEQLLLGGDTGLRGYPRNIQSGNRRYLVTLEQRFYTNYHIFQLFHVGGAVFFDAGEAWYTEGPWVGDNLGLLRDVGVGLRLGSSRSSRGSMVHVDLAYPLDAGFDDVQLVIRARDTF